MAKVSKARIKLLVDLERIVGNQFYNGNIQNWGPGGLWEGEGREFRYPITFFDTWGNKLKRWSIAEDISPEVMRTGYYAVGANHLYIMKALERIVSYLERTHDFKIKS
jgi:hypothetical protein